MTTQAPKTRGRPKFWTEDKIDTLAIDLIEWAKKDNSYALVQFCAETALIPEKFSKLAKENEEFRQALMYVKSILASRMIESLNLKDGRIHPVFFNKYIRLNDLILDEHCRELEKKDAESVAQHIIEIIDFSKIRKEKDE